VGVFLGLNALGKPTIGAARGLCDLRTNERRGNGSAWSCPRHRGKSKMTIIFFDHIFHIMEKCPMKN